MGTSWSGRSDYQELRLIIPDPERRSQKMKKLDLSYDSSYVSMAVILMASILIALLLLAFLVSGEVWENLGQKVAELR
jgi:hypothetical protein